MIRSGYKKERWEMFGNHYALYIQIRVNVTEKKKMGMCELLSLRLLNFPFTHTKEKHRTEHYL